MITSRYIDNKIQKHFEHYKQVLVLLGPRQVGKTTLLKRLFPKAVYLLVDNEPIRKILESYDINTYRQTFDLSENELFIDEIQQISDPGRAVKILYDLVPNLKIVVSGSSSFQIKNKASESLAGRKIDYFLYPLTFSEYLTQKGIEQGINVNIFNNCISDKAKIEAKMHIFDMNATLNNVLVYGLYPSLVNYPMDSKYLTNLVESVVFKDLLDLKLIENRSNALNVLKLLAHQIGNLVNYAEIAQNVGIDQRTVKKYIDIFEQSFILYRLQPFSKNDRDEIRRTPKIYFYDIGLRNALIDNFSDLNMRPDKGALFENFIINECVKANMYLDADYKLSFWRSKSGAEVDLVLTKGTKTIGVEIKYMQTDVTQAFVNRYPTATIKNLNAVNFF